MDTQTQIERLIELAIIQRSELKQLVEQLPQLREHLNAEVERTFEEAEPQIRTELEEFVTRQAADKTATLGVALEAKIGELAKSLEESAQAKYSALIATRDQNATLLAQAEERIAAASAELPAKVKDIVAAELARFPRAGEIDQLRKEFAEPRGLNPRGKWQAGESYNKLDLVTINGDSYTSNTDNNITRPTRSSSDWTLVAARGAGGGGGPTSLSELTTVPSNGDILIGSGTSWVTSNLTAGAGISITVGAGEITISATDGDITLDDGTAASPSLHFTNDADTGLYRPAANTLGISVSGTQVAYFDTDGLTIPSAGVVAGGSFHGANGNANNPTFSFESDQDTGMYRHGTNELGFTVGGTEKAVLTSTTFTITPNLVTSGNLTVSGTVTSGGTGTFTVVRGSTSLLTDGFAVVGGVAQFDTGNNLNIRGATGGISFYNSVAGSSNNWSIIKNTATASNSNLEFSTGAGIALTLNHDKSATLAGNLTVSGQINGSAGYQFRGASGTTYEVLRYAGGTNNPGLFATVNESTKKVSLIASGSVNTGQVLVLGAEGSETLTLGTANATLAGNLTVSGTGTSSVGGKLQSIVPSATGYNQLYDTSGITTGRGAFGITSTGAGLALGIESSVGGTSFTNSTAYSSYFGTTTATPIHLVTNASISATITSGGNLLLGTTTDGGQKLQVAGTIRSGSGSGETLSSGSIDVGADIGIASTQGIVQGGARIVTFTSGNATFAGNTTAKGTAHYFGADNSQRIELTSNNGSSQGLIEFYNRGTSAYFAARYLALSHTFEQGPIAINNTVQTAAAVASTHKVTISIGGTTYYLLASNV